MPLIRINFLRFAENCEIYAFFFSFSINYQFLNFVFLSSITKNERMY